MSKKEVRKNLISTYEDSNPGDDVTWDFTYSAGHYKFQKEMSFRIRDNWQVPWIRFVKDCLERSGNKKLNVTVERNGYSGDVGNDYYKAKLVYFMKKLEGDEVTRSEKVTKSEVSPPRSLFASEATPVKKNDIGDDNEKIKMEEVQKVG
jgi:hypothetical protein